MSASILWDDITPALARLKAIFPRKSWAEILRPNARLIGVNLAFQTQPFGNDADARAKGENAIAADMLGGGKRGGIIKLWKDYMPSQADASGTTRLFASAGKVYAVETPLFDLRGQQIAAQRNRYRSKTTGRISHRGGVYRTEGRLNYLDQLIVREDAWQRTFRKLKKMVGFAKAGWSVCCDALGGHRGIPQWVSRHKASGRVIDQSSSETNPNITLINDVHYIDRCLNEGQVREALRIQAEKMTKHADYVIAGEARKAGFAVR